MSRPSEADVHAARRLLKRACRLTHAGEAHVESAAAGELLGLLFQSLGPVIGATGVAATFERSLKLSRAEYPCLDELLTTGDEPRGSHNDVSQRLTICLRKLTPAAASVAATSLFATFFRLLSSFIGEQLFWQIVRGGFPDGADFEFEERD